MINDGRVPSEISPKYKIMYAHSKYPRRPAYRRRAIEDAECRVSALPAAGGGCYRETHAPRHTACSPQTALYRIVELRTRACPPILYSSISPTHPSGDCHHVPSALRSRGTYIQVATAQVWGRRHRIMPSCLAARQTTAGRRSPDPTSAAHSADPGAGSPGNCTGPRVPSSGICAASPGSPTSH